MWEALYEFHRKPIECGFPVMDRHRPFLCNVAHGQIDHFIDGFIGRKNPMITRDFAQRHIDRLDGIGGVDHFANILWKGKQGDHADPVGSPGLANAGIEPIPFLEP